MHGIYLHVYTLCFVTRVAPVSSVTASCMSHSLTHFGKATINRCLIAGLEPHSALPVALPMVFTDHCDLLPKGLRGIKILAHTAVTFLNFRLSSFENGFFENYINPQNPTAVIMIAVTPHCTASSSSSMSLPHPAWLKGSVQLCQLLFCEHVL